MCANPKKCIPHIISNIQNCKLTQVFSLFGTFKFNFETKKEQYSRLYYVIVRHENLLSCTLMIYSVLKFSLVNLINYIAVTINVIKLSKAMLALTTKMVYIYCIYIYNKWV